MYISIFHSGESSLNCSLGFVLELLGLLFTEHLFITCLELASQLLCPSLDTLDSHFMIAVALFKISHTDEYRVLHLLLLFLDLLEQFWVEHLESWRTIALALLPSNGGVGRLTTSECETDSGLLATIDARVHALVLDRFLGLESARSESGCVKAAHVCCMTWLSMTCSWAAAAEVSLAKH